MKLYTLNQDSTRGKNYRAPDAQSVSQAEQGAEIVSPAAEKQTAMMFLLLALLTHDLAGTKITKPASAGALQVQVLPTPQNLRVQ